MATTQDSPSVIFDQLGEAVQNAALRIEGAASALGLHLFQACLLRAMQ